MDKLINYDDVPDYIKKLMIYLQLFKPNRLEINKVTVKIDDDYYGLMVPIEELKYKTSIIENSVEDNLSKFLLKCYHLIPYRNSKNEIRNIPYIILNTYRNIEDNFLMFYRFIECYYKQKPIKNIKNSFIKYSIENNYKDKDKIQNLKNIEREIICLRNHYVHNGYHISNKKLYISFKKIGKKANPKNYRAENVDFYWIYERTKILYKIVIDIIFKEMLQYDNYEFNKYF